MGAYAKIQLNDLGYLDIEDGSAFPLNFDNAPIQDISKRLGNYSKTISLASTSNNHKLLGYLFDTNVSDSSFDKNVKAACSVIQNGVTILPNCYLQLLSINKKSPALIDGDQIITYSVCIKSDNGDFYSAMGESLLTDLDFSQYNHIYTLSAITSTSANTYVDVYKYHNYYHAGGNYRLTDYKPSIFHNTYLNKIISGAGYSYEWNDISEVGAEKMIVPYNGDKPQYRIAETDSKKFQAGFSGGQQTIAITSSTLSSRTIKWDDDSTRVNFDSGGTYNPSTGKYVADYYGSTILKTKFQYEIYLSASTAATMSVSSAFGTPPASATLGKSYSTTAFFYKNGSGIGASPSTTFDSFSYLCGTTISSGLTYVKSGVTNELSVNPAYSTTTGYNVYPSAEFFVALNNSSSDIISLGSFVLGMDWQTSGGSHVPVYVVVKVGAVSADTNTNYYKNEPSITDVNEGATIFMNDFIPKKIKQKDFIADTVKAFNLYITPSKEKPNHLIIQTRDNFYDSGISVDWTDKFQVDKEHTITFLPDLQKKKVLFTYKDGAKDIWNSSYKNAVAEVYGQFEYTFLNEFVKDVQRIECSVFEPTPINEDLTFGNLVSTIDTVAPKTGLRLLYDCGWITGNTWNFDSLNGSSFATTSFSTYPFASHFYPNAKTPTEDLNFGICDYYYYDTWTYLTNNNLYNKHYKRFINQIETGKLLTDQKNQIEALKSEYKNLSKSAIQSSQELAAEEAKHIEERKKKYKEFGDNIAKLAKGVVEVGTGIALAFGASKESTEKFEKSLANIVGISSTVKGGIEVVQRSVAMLGGGFTIAIGLVAGLIAGLAWLLSSESDYEKAVRETTEAIKEQEEASKNLTVALTLHYDLAIAQARQAGKDTTDLSRQKIEASIQHLKTETENLIAIDKLREKAFRNDIQRQIDAGGLNALYAQAQLEQSKQKDSEEFKAKKELHQKIITSQQQVKRLEIDLINFNTDVAIKATDEEKKQNDKSVENYKKAQAEKERLLKERIANERAEREFEEQQEREAIARGNAYNKAQQEAEDERIKAAKAQFDADNLFQAAYIDEEKLKQHIKTKEELLKEDIDLANKRIDYVGFYVNAASSLTSSLFALTNNLGKQDDASKLERAKRQFNITKAVNIAEAAINGAKAITKGIAEFGPPPSPLGIAAIVTAGAITAAQIAAIASCFIEGFNNELYVCLKLFRASASDSSHYYALHLYNRTSDKF